MIEKIDFLIIGAGISGLSTAIELQKFGKVLLLLKNGYEDSNTFYAAGGIASSGPWSKDYEGHIQDTLIAGDGLCNKDVVEFVVNNGTKHLQNLIDWGVKFDKKSNGEYDLGQEGGHHTRRVLHTGDLTGSSILEVLI